MGIGGGGAIIIFFTNIDLVIAMVTGQFEINMCFTDDMFNVVLLVRESWQKT